MAERKTAWIISGVEGKCVRAKVLARSGEWAITEASKRGCPRAITHLPTGMSACEVRHLKVDEVVALDALASIRPFDLRQWDRVKASVIGLLAQVMKGDDDA